MSGISSSTSHSHHRVVRISGIGCRCPKKAKCLAEKYPVNVRHHEANHQVKAWWTFWSHVSQGQFDLAQKTAQTSIRSSDLSEALKVLADVRAQALQKRARTIRSDSRYGGTEPRPCIGGRFRMAVAITPLEIRSPDQMADILIDLLEHATTSPRSAWSKFEALDYLAQGIVLMELFNVGLRRDEHPRIAAYLKEKNRHEINEFGRELSSAWWKSAMASDR